MKVKITKVAKKAKKEKERYCKALELSKKCPECGSHKIRSSKNIRNFIVSECTECFCKFEVKY